MLTVGDLLTDGVLVGSTILVLALFTSHQCRGTSLIRNSAPLGPYSRVEVSSRSVVQTYGLSPECVLVCVARRLGSENALPHVSHTYHITPECVRMCVARLSARKNALPHAQIQLTCARYPVRGLDDLKLEHSACLSLSLSLSLSLPLPPVL